jgi:hypothetical protein
VKGAVSRKSEKLRPHHPLPRIIGSRRGRSNPRRAIALATAGPTGGTPGSPTPVGFSANAQRTIGVEVVLQGPPGLDSDLGKKYVTESDVEPNLLQI